MGPNVTDEDVHIDSGQEVSTKSKLLFLMTYLNMFNVMQNHAAHHEQAGA